LQNNTNGNYFPHSSENHSINGILLNCVQDNAEKKPQGKQDSINEADGPEEGEVIDDGDSTGIFYGKCTAGTLELRGLTKR